MSSYVLHRSMSLPTTAVISSDGITLNTSTGPLIDAVCGTSVSVLGYKSTYNQEVLAAIRDQINQAAYVYSGTLFTTSSVEELARVIIMDKPGDFAKAMFLNSGSEAVEAAIKLARQYFVEAGEPQRVNFIARERSFHGNTLGSLAAGGDFGRRKIYEPLLATNHSFVSPAYPYRLQHLGETDSEYVTRLGDELDAQFQQLGGNTVCAFLCETIMGSTRGSILPPPGYLNEVRRVCDKYGALLILDEVMCGLGKTGTFHAWMAEDGFRGPDIQTVAKALGAGYVPISAVLVGKKVAGMIERGSGEIAHGHTYQAHPLSCAAALAVQRIILRDNLIEHVKETGPYLQRLLFEKLKDLPYIGEIRGRGFFWGIELVEDKETKKPYSAELQIAFKVLYAARNLGLCILAANGTQDDTQCDHLALMLPFVARKEDCNTIVCLLYDALVSVLGDGEQKGKYLDMDGLRSN